MGNTQESMDNQKDLLVLAGAPLEIEIELLDVAEPGGFTKQVWEMTAIEKYTEAPLQRDKVACPCQLLPFPSVLGLYPQHHIKKEFPKHIQTPRAPNSTKPATSKPPAMPTRAPARSSKASRSRPPLLTC